MRLRLSPFVPDDLEQIAHFIAQDSPRQAARMLRLFHARMKEIARRPQLYRLRPELAPITFGLRWKLRNPLPRTPRHRSN